MRAFCSVRTGSPRIKLGLVAGGLFLAREAWRLLRGSSQDRGFPAAFRSINIYALFVMALLVVDAML